MAQLANGGTLSSFLATQRLPSPVLSLCLKPFSQEKLMKMADIEALFIAPGRPHLQLEWLALLAAIKDCLMKLTALHAVFLHAHIHTHTHTIYIYIWACVCYTATVGYICAILLVRFLSDSRTGVAQRCAAVHHSYHDALLAP